MNIDNICDELKAKFARQEKTIAELSAENARLKSEKYKDEELAKMKLERDKAISEAGLGFPMTKEECDAINAWADKHMKEKHSNKYCSAIGGYCTYEFIPTGIGVIGTVKCVCGESFTFRELL